MGSSNTTSKFSPSGGGQGEVKNQIQEHPFNYYNKELKDNARQLRKHATKAEACLWKYVLRARMLKGYQFRRQRPVLHYIADFMCPELKLIIEVDGITHTYEESVEKDVKRQRDLEQIGFTVLRFEDNEVLTAIDRVRAKLVAWIESNPDLPPPSPRQRERKKTIKISPSGGGQGEVPC